MIKYENPFVDGHMTERDVTFKGVQIGVMVTERIHEGSMRFKGSLVVHSYNIYIFHMNYSSTFYVYDYESARQALSACKRFIKTMIDQNPIEGETK